MGGSAAALGLSLGGNLLGGLFGGGETEGTPGQVIDVLPDEFANIRTPLSDEIRAFLASRPSVSSDLGSDLFGGSFNPLADANRFVAPLTNTEKIGLDRIEELIRAVPAGTEDSIKFFRNTLSGDFLGDNPFINFFQDPRFRNPLSAEFAQTGTNQFLNPERLTGAFNPFLNAQEFTLNGSNPFLSTALLSPDTNPFLQATIEAATRPIIEAFQENTLPRLRASFTDAGQFIQPQGSSPFDLAVARASSGLANAVGDTSAEISFANFNNALNILSNAFESAQGRRFGAFEGELDRQNQQASIVAQLFENELNRASQNLQFERNQQTIAASQLPAIDQGELNRVIQGLQASALPRLIQQQGVDTGLAQFNQQLTNLLSAIGISSDLTGANANTVVLQPTPAPASSGGNIFSDVLSGAAGLAKALPGTFGAQT